MEKGEEKSGPKEEGRKQDDETNFRHLKHVKLTLNNSFLNLYTKMKNVWWEELSNFCLISSS